MTDKPRYNLSETTDESTPTSPAALIQAGEEEAQQNPLAGSVGRDAAWEIMQGGATKHEKSTFKSMEAARQNEGITQAERSHDPSGGAFLWMTAIEGSTIPQLNVDQMDWTQHYEFWKEDLRRVRVELGIKHLRVSPPWYKLNPGPGIFDWSWWDAYVDYAAGELGFNLMVDLAHFGTPLWMLKQWAEPDFPAHFAAYAQKFAARYKDKIKTYCPVNEPYITALFSGDLGCWPPYLQGEENFPPIMANISRAIIDASLAIKAEIPDATLMFIDTTENAWSPDASLDPIINERNLRRFISFDMAMGKVNHDHPLTEWLLRNHFSETDLQYFVDNPAPVDILGLDYYPQSEAILRVIDKENNYNQKDMMGARRVDKLWNPKHLAPQERDWPVGFYGVAKAYQTRYNKPIVLAETNWCGGPIEHRLRWMNYTLDDCKRLRAEGFPLIGYCWWGAYDHMDWGLALRLHSGKVHPVGLWNLKRKNWILERVPCPLFDRYKKAIHNTEVVVGPFALRGDAVLP